MHNATPTRLKSGDWGARVPVNDQPIAEGDRITITAKSGKSWEALIGRIMYRGNGVVICTTRRTKQTALASADYALSQAPTNRQLRKEQRRDRYEDAPIYHDAGNGGVWVEY